jgi:hypothetical protein
VLSHDTWVPTAISATPDCTTVPVVTATKEEGSNMPPLSSGLVSGETKSRCLGIFPVIIGAKIQRGDDICKYFVIFFYSPANRAQKKRVEPFGTTLFHNSCYYPTYDQKAYGHKDHSLNEGPDVFFFALFHEYRFSSISLPDRK